MQILNSDTTKKNSHINGIENINGPVHVAETITVKKQINNYTRKIKSPWVLPFVAIFFLLALMIIVYFNKSQEYEITTYGDCSNPIVNSNSATIDCRVEENK